MPLIPFPDIPAYPGVPPIPRSVLSNPAISIGLGTVESVLLAALQQPQQWGIFDQFGNLLGIDSSGSLSIESIIANQITGGGNSVQSTLKFEFLKENKTPTFPVEGGKFANYNKLILPANPTVTLVLSGSEAERTQFLAAIDDACDSTDIYNVVTPEVTYVGYSLNSYRYARSASSGSTLLIVEIVLQEVLQVSAAFTQAQSPISAPQAPDAAAQVNNGITQASEPDTSVLQSIATKLGISN